MTAPTCPISNSETPYQRLFTRGSVSGTPPGSVAPALPSIPNAIDLPSLIRTTNVLRDVLRSLTTSLTVNNVWYPKPPFFKATGDTHYSQYPEWDQKTLDVSYGFMYHHDKDGIDETQRAHVRRINQVVYENRMQDDPPFVWHYYKPLDSLGIEPLFPTANPMGGDTPFVYGPPDPGEV